MATNNLVILSVNLDFRQYVGQFGLLQIDGNFVYFTAILVVEAPKLP